MIEWAKKCKNCGKSIPKEEYDNLGARENLDLSGLCYRCAVNRVIWYDHVVYARGDAVN